MLQPVEMDRHVGSRAGSETRPCTVIQCLECPDVACPAFVVGQRPDGRLNGA
jgi:hypothetical protein